MDRKNMQQLIQRHFIVHIQSIFKNYIRIKIYIYFFNVWEIAHDLDAILS